MKYDLNDLNTRIRKNKTIFLSKLGVFIILAVVFILLMAFSGIGEVIILSGVGLLAILFFVINLFEKFSPKVLFSKEIKGENIKEGEYEIMKRGSYAGNGLRHKQVGARGGAMPYAPNTRANRKSFHKNMHFSGEVYLKEDDGNVVLIRGLYTSQMEIYEEGDILLKPAGCKFPIVISREAERQPCPICCEVNGGEQESCSSCGLKITN